MEKKTRKKSDFLNSFKLKGILTKNIDKYGIINLLIWISIPVIIALIIIPKNDYSNDSSNFSYESSGNSSSTSSNSTYFTNKYGNSTTKCKHSGCNRKIASTGDTNCCTIHSSKCRECGKYIDEDATYCMDCIEKALKK